MSVPNRRAVRRDQLQRRRNDVAKLTTQIAKDQKALDLPVGVPVPAEQLPKALCADDITLDALPGDLWSAVLLKRPDVLLAEDQLIPDTPTSVRPARRSSRRSR